MAIKLATSNEIEEAIYGNEFCFDCRHWRDDPCAKTQCKIAGMGCCGENYRGYWKNDNGKIYCEKWQSRKNRKRKQKVNPDQVLIGEQ